MQVEPQLAKLVAGFHAVIPPELLGDLSEAELVCLPWRPQLLHALVVPGSGLREIT